VRLHIRLQVLYKTINCDTYSSLDPSKETKDAKELSDFFSMVVPLLNREDQHRRLLELAVEFLDFSVVGTLLSSLDPFERKAYEGKNKKKALIRRSLLICIIDL
jgi:hypothetical protein